MAFGSCVPVVSRVVWGRICTSAAVCHSPVRRCGCAIDVSHCAARRAPATVTTGTPLSHAIKALKMMEATPLHREKTPAAKQCMIEAQTAMSCGGASKSRTEGRGKRGQPLITEKLSLHGTGKVEPPDLMVLKVAKTTPRVVLTRAMFSERGGRVLFKDAATGDVAQSLPPVFALRHSIYELSRRTSRPKAVHSSASGIALAAVSDSSGCFCHVPLMRCHKFVGAACVPTYASQAPTGCWKRWKTSRGLIMPGCVAERGIHRTQSISKIKPDSGVCVCAYMRLILLMRETPQRVQAGNRQRRQESRARVAGVKGWAFWGRGG